MAQFPALPFWTDAYAADTEHLSYFEHGLYQHILRVMWRSPQCRIPNDDDWLRKRFAKASLEQIWAILGEFCQSDGNWISQKRLLKEWQWVQEKRKKNTDAANSRWDNEKDVCERNAGAMRRQSERNAPTPTPTPKLRKKDPEENIGGVKNGNGKHRKPRHGQRTKNGLRVWLDRGTSEWSEYAIAYAERHGGSKPPTQWNDSGTWFDLATGDA